MINIDNIRNIIYKKKTNTYHCSICNDLMIDDIPHYVNDCLFIKGTYKYRPIIKKRYSKYFNNNGYRYFTTH